MTIAKHITIILIGDMIMAKVVDIIKEQADRYDGKNMQFEQDILWRIRRAHDRMNSSILSKARSCNKLVDMQTMLNEIEKVYTSFNNAVINLLRSNLEDYADRAYENTGDLIELGKETSGKLSSGVQEQRKLQYSEDIIDIIKNSAFSDIQGKSNSQIEKMRKELISMILAGTATRSNVRDMIQKVLDSDTSYAELVAQTEMSAVYNMGTIKRMKEYSRISGHRIKKYWHGFKYSENTCEYCRPRIGGIYDLDDESETLPAHPRCRCLWLPYEEEWDEAQLPDDEKIEKLDKIYSDEVIAGRINQRLDVKYGDRMSRESAVSYLAGDRSTKIMDALRQARQEYINNIIDQINVEKDTSNTRMMQEFNDQLDFWKKYVASCIADNNQDALRTAITAIEGLMELPWNSEQMDKWNQLLSKIQDNIR